MSGTAIDVPNAVNDETALHLVDSHGDFIVTSNLPDSIELAVQKMVCRQLQTITPANGYRYDMSGSGAVQRGRLYFSPVSDPKTMISVVEGLPPNSDPFAVERSQIMRQENLELLVQGWATEGVDDFYPTDPVYYLKACAEQVLSRLISTNGDRPAFPEGVIGVKSNYGITDFRIGAGGVRPAENGVSETAFFYIPLVIVRAADLSQPFVAT